MDMQRPRGAGGAVAPASTSHPACRRTWTRRGAMHV